MPRFEFVTHPEQASGPEIPPEFLDGLLYRTGLQWGCAAARTQGSSSEPRLRHARALLQLQQRFGPMDHVHRRRATSASPASLLATPAQPEADEWLLVVEGQLGAQWAVPGGWLRAEWGVLEWFTRPAGLRALPLPRDPARAPEAAEWLVLSRARRRGLESTAGRAGLGAQPVAGHEALQPPALPVPWRLSGALAGAWA